MDVGNAKSGESFSQSMLRRADRLPFRGLEPRRTWSIEKMASTPKHRAPQRRLRQQQAERRRLEAALEEGLRETFPASDPVAVTEPRRQAAQTCDVEPERS